MRRRSLWWIQEVKCNALLAKKLTLLPSVSKSTNVVVLISPVTKEMIYYTDLKETLDTG